MCKTVLLWWCEDDKDIKLWLLNQAVMVTRDKDALRAPQRQERLLIFMKSYGTLQSGLCYLDSSVCLTSPQRLTLSLSLFIGWAPALFPPLLLPLVLCPLFLYLLPHLSLSFLHLPFLLSPFPTLSSSLPPCPSLLFSLCSSLFLPPSCLPVCAFVSGLHDYF